MNINDDFQVEFGGFVVQVGDIDPVGIRYLLQYGFAQSLQDCVAGREKKFREAVFPEDHENAGESMYSTRQVYEMLIDLQRKRIEAIRTGTVGTRSSGGGGGLTPAEKMFQTVAKEFLANAAKAQGKKLPKMSEPAYETILAAYSKKYATKISAEAERRMALAPAGDELDGL